MFHDWVGNSGQSKIWRDLGNPLTHLRSPTNILMPIMLKDDEYLYD